MINLGKVGSFYLIAKPRLTVYTKSGSADLCLWALVIVWATAHSLVTPRVLHRRFIAAGRRSYSPRALWTGRNDDQGLFVISTCSATISKIDLKHGLIAVHMSHHVNNPGNTAGIELSSASTPVAPTS